MAPQRVVRTLAAGALVGAGWALTRAARGFRQAAEVVKPEQDRREGPAGPVVTDRAGPLGSDEGRPAVQEPPTVVAADADAPAHLRLPETHVEELAGRPAADVIDAIETLSTDELSRLYEHEQANKKRKTVLQAIERALTPASS